jgi:hypothetical protein
MMQDTKEVTQQCYIGSRQLLKHTETTYVFIFNCLQGKVFHYPALSPQNPPQKLILNNTVIKLTRRGVNPKKWDVQKLQESKEIKQKYQRRIKEKVGENRGGEGNVEEN